MDVVITYVDDTEGLRKDYAQYCKKNFQENRFRSYGVLDLQVKGIRKYMPYVKNIFIVVNYKIQVKDYDFTGLDVKIIEHSQIIPKLFLPCFNSCAIEMFFHNIPGLDEEFVYFNDDMFVIDDSPYEHWFQNGKPCLYMRIQNIDTTETNTYVHRLYNDTKNVCGLLNNGLYTGGKFLRPEHCPYPLLKSTYNEVWKKCNKEIKKSLTRIRNSKNFNVNLFNIYDYISGNCIEYSHNYDYTVTHDDSIFDIIISKTSELICINDENLYINEFKELLKYALCKNLGIKTKKVKLSTHESAKRYHIKIPTTEIKTDEKIIISLTSYPARIKYVKRVLESLVNQSVNNDLYHIVLVLAIPEFPEKEEELPYGLIKYIIDNNIELLWYPTNIRSHKKLIPTLLKYPDNPILVCDDDVIRPDGWLQMFINDHNKYPNDIIGGLYSWYFGNDYKLKRFKDFKCVNSGTINGIAGIQLWNAKPANGFGGVLYPAHTFTDKRFFDEKLFMKLSPTSDESWQYCFNIMANKVFRQTSQVIDYSLYFIEHTQEISSSLHKVNNYTEINKLLFENFPEFKQQLNKRGKRIIVSLTSHGNRVKYLYKTLNSLLHQTLKPYKICVTLSEDDTKLLTNDVKQLIVKKKIELITVKNDLGPHTKYFYVMQKYRDYAILTVDDDHDYDTDLVESLYKCYLNNPTAISARRVHRIKWDKNGELLPYKEWYYQYKQCTEPSFELFATGVGGILYPPDILSITDDNIPDIKECLYADDIYLKWLENQKHIKVVWCKNNNVEGTRLTDKEIVEAALYHQNNGNNRNDMYLKKFNLEQL